MLREYYEKTVVPKLSEKFAYQNKMEIPKLAKIVVNNCLSDAVTNSKVLDTAVQEMTQITGQKPVICKAKKSIAGFKLREGVPIACRVTLRRENMYEFFNRLVNVALPRSRDFKGLSKKGFDGRGNYTLGLPEQIIFPEIVIDKVEKNRGMNITIVTTAKTNEEGEALLKEMGFPFRT